MTIYVKGACIYISSNSSGMTALLPSCAVQEDLVLWPECVVWFELIVRYIRVHWVRACPRPPNRYTTDWQWRWDLGGTSGVRRRTDHRATARMLNFRHLSESETDKESITAYVERAQLFFNANDIKEEKQLAILLSVIGRKTFALLRSHVTGITQGQILWTTSRSTQAAFWAKTCDHCSESIFIAEVRQQVSR